MKILQCDSCHAQVYDYGHWYNGEKPRNMYELNCIDESNSDTYDGMIICHKCIAKLLHKDSIKMVTNAKEAEEYQISEDISKGFEEFTKMMFKQGQVEREEAQPKQTDDSCLDFDFDKVKEILKKDCLDNLIVVHTCEEKQEQTRNEKIIDDINFAIKATDSKDNYSMGMRNGMRYVKSLIDGKEPQYELRQTDEEINLGIDIGDEVVNEWGAKGVVVGIDTDKEAGVMLSLLMKKYKVPQLVQASRYKTKTGRYFPQIIEVLTELRGK